MARKPKPVKVKRGGSKPEPVPAKSTVPATTQARDPLVSLRREIDRLFDDFLTGFRWPFFGRSLFEMEPFGRFEPLLGVTAPSVDLSETDKAYEVTAELPGMDEKDIELLLSDDVLTIKGEKKEEKEERKKEYYHSERRYGSFTRSFRLPEDIDQGKISASFKNGVLTVTLPKTSEARRKVKRISVKAT
ncbi:MAG: Hsp20/alpha crystallin family protein [Kiloniellales bacterium]